MVTRTEPKLVTGKIDGLDVTVPAGTTILEAARSIGIEIPNLCFQPLMRPWGSCRMCTVEILGKRGGLDTSCSVPLGEGMEVLTHPEEVEESRQFLLQMLLVDHALDCPTCDKSGECYLQDNTYLHNVNTNPYRRPKMAKPYVHFSDYIDYKWDRCIMCARCFRVCDEMIGVTAIEGAARALEASVVVGYGQDLSDTTCTNCGMCIAVCPVGALTDRHFAHHPWELDTTETICGFCDIGCTINVESNKGIVRRATHLWERGVNHGYTCEQGRWGHEQVQHPDRLVHPQIHEAGNPTYEISWDEAIDTVAENLAHFQGDQFAALASGDSTNEEVYLLQEFTRAVMGSNNIDRLLSPNQIAVEQAVRRSLGRDVVNTNNIEELFTDVRAAMVVGPNLGKTEPVASYWFYHALQYREAKIVVISQEEYPLCRRAELWLKPNEGTTPTLLNGIARQIIDLGLAVEAVDVAEWAKTLTAYDAASVSKITGISQADLQRAAVLYATGGAGNADSGRPEDGYPPALIYQTAAHQGDPGIPATDGDPAEISIACNNLAIITGNIGRAGGGVAALRGPANYQGATDMGAHPSLLPGGFDIEDSASREAFEAVWLSRWGERAKTHNGFLPITKLPARRGIGLADLPAAIERGEIKAMYIENSVDGRFRAVHPELLAALPKLELLIVADSYDSPLAQLADVVLPRAMSLEKDGTFTNFDRTVQRLRQAVPPMGEARSGVDVLTSLSRRMGYNLERRSANQVMTEISRLVPDYHGVTYARLERGGLTVPVENVRDGGVTILSADPNGLVTLHPTLLASVN